ncbi:MAG TPA: GNAT family N-acetyltransferase [Anaerolineae bacterium]|nr:GNAT family N-acetyltransferase [Anaerolineae bacterium]
MIDPLHDKPFDAPARAEGSNGAVTSRCYETEHDLWQMQDLLMQVRLETDDWRYAHVGDLLFQFLMVACHLNPREHIHLWHAAGKLVGYAVLGEDPAIDWQILPEYEWRGIETEAMAWADTRMAGLHHHDAQQWGGHCVSGARQDNARRIAFLEQHGFRPGHQFSEVNMLRSLDEPIPEAIVPAGCQVRAVAGADEIPNRAAAQREVLHPWTVGNVSDDDYAYFMRLPGYQRDLDVVAAAPDGVIAAYVNGWIDPVNRIGDFGPVGARPAYRRQGLTRAVLLEGMRRMQARGMNRVSVSTGLSNTPAIRLYESVGFEVVNQYLEYVQTD